MPEHKTENPKASKDSEAAGLGSAAETKSKGLPKGVTAEIKRTQEERARGLISNIDMGWCTLAFHKVMDLIDNDDPQAVEQTGIFLSLPSEAFQPETPMWELPVEKRHARDDAAMYYMFVCELYLKAYALFNLINPVLDDMCVNTHQALVCSCSMMLNDYVVEYPGAVTKYLELINNFQSATQMLIAPAILPKTNSLGQFDDIWDAFDFMFLSADMLFYMTCYGSVEAYIRSGYMRPELLSSTELKEAAGVLLDKFYTAIDELMNKSC